MNTPSVIESIPENITRYSGTVAVWFSGHYQLDPRDWNNIKEFNGEYHPLHGYYRSDDPGVLTQQLQYMRRTGIDAIVYDVFPVTEWKPTDFAKDRVLAMLMDALANQGNESRPLQLFIYLEHYTANPTLEEYEFALDYIREHMSETSYYYRYHGKPLVVCYLNGDAPAMDDIEKCGEYTDYFELRRIRPFRTGDWSYIEPYPQTERKDWMCASPGYDSYLEDAYLTRYVRNDKETSLDDVRQRGARAERDEGRYYLDQLNLAKQVDPEIILVSTWNDWQFANQIEPAEEYGFLYVDMTAKALGRWQETALYRG
jgi:hypothetical protein